MVHLESWCGSARSSASLNLQPRPCRHPSPISTQSSRLTLPCRLFRSSNVQSHCSLWPSEFELRPPRPRPDFITPATAGTLDVHCMYLDSLQSPSLVPHLRRDDEAVVHLLWIRQISVQQSWPAAFGCRSACRRLGAVTTFTMCNFLSPPSIMLAICSPSG
jgi:hypothetical protein